MCTKMIVLFVLALTIYWLAIDTLTSLPSKSNQREALLRGVNTPEEVELFEKEHLLLFKNRKTVLQVLVTTAPLLGLLGTVSGMLAIFDTQILSIFRLLLIHHPKILPVQIDE